MKPHSIATITTLLITSALSAIAEQAPEKTYGPLLRPTAIEDRRAMSIDRPNITDVPYSVDSGVLQIETSLIEYTRDTYNGTRTEITALAVTNLRIGLTDDWEIQAAITPVAAVRTRSAGAVTEDSGVGDTLIRTRYVLQGNDGEGLAIALLPYLKLPTNTVGFNDRLEGGFEVPLAYNVSATTQLNLMPGVELLWSGQSARHYDPNPFLGFAIWHNVTPEIAGFAEIFAKRNTGYHDDAFILAGACGGLWQITPDISVDLALQFGLTEGAPDFAAKTGFAVRF